MISLDFYRNSIPDHEIDFKLRAASPVGKLVVKPAVV
jgi:hypothetical protein